MRGKRARPRAVKRKGPRKTPPLGAPIRRKAGAMRHRLTPRAGAGNTAIDFDEWYWPDEDEPSQEG